MYDIYMCVRPIVVRPVLRISPPPPFCVRFGPADVVAEGARDDLRRRHERNVWVRIAHGDREAQGTGAHHVIGLIDPSIDPSIADDDDDDDDVGLTF